MTNKLTRRKFIKSSLIISGTAITGINGANINFGKSDYISNRPKINERKFVSSAVESIIKK